MTIQENALNPVYNHALFCDVYGDAQSTPKAGKKLAISKRDGSVIEFTTEFSLPTAIQFVREMAETNDFALHLANLWTRKGEKMGTNNINWCYYLLQQDEDRKQNRAIINKGIKAVSGVEGFKETFRQVYFALADRNDLKQWSEVDVNGRDGHALTFTYTGSDHKTNPDCFYIKKGGTYLGKLSIDGIFLAAQGVDTTEVVEFFK